MWARVVEFMLACWLAISPFVFGHPPDRPLWWAIDFGAALAVATLALISYWPPTRHAHLATLLIALGLIAFGRFGTPEPIPPASQNHIIVGLLLLMLPLVPNHADRPPEAWYGDRQFTS